MVSRSKIFAARSNLYEMTFDEAAVPAHGSDVLLEVVPLVVLWIQPEAVTRCHRCCLPRIDNGQPTYMDQTGEEIGMKTALVAAIVVSAVMAASAQAKVTDPRKCAYGADKRAQCAHAAALLVTRKVLQHRVGQTFLWQGPLTCTSQGTLLRWRCAFAQQHPELPPKGYVAVTYKATHTGWHVYTSIVATP